MLHRQIMRSIANVTAAKGLFNSNPKCSNSFDGKLVETFNSIAHGAEGFNDINGMRCMFCRFLPNKTSSPEALTLVYLPDQSRTRLKALLFSLSRV